MAQGAYHFAITPAFMEHAQVLKSVSASLDGEVPPAISLVLKGNGAKTARRIAPVRMEPDVILSVEHVLASQAGKV